MILVLLLMLSADDTVRPRVTADPFVEKTRAAVARFIKGLPDYECRQTTTRHVRRRKDVITAVLTYVNGRDFHRDVVINGEPTTREAALESGLWFVGDFGPLLRTVFAEATAARFERLRDETFANEKVAIYQFSVDQEHSRWSVAAGAEKIVTAFHGKVWIAREGAHVLRIELRAELPRTFLANAAEVSGEYRWFELGDRRFLLPARTESTLCTRRDGCRKNLTEFSDYRKFVANSTITFKDQ